ncbi:LLM class flavin-dependent oxidoreductase [Neotabrizicola sp. VNH66]|uniref:LLM class flavin-dependent oxidoreductase n=1 Tax=Neotabrizicola sp. VNH66 TaxID=3400918 RepID=UPI003C06136F
MKIGNMLFPESASPDGDAARIHETLAEAQLSERLGVDMLWLAEHHFDGNCAYVDPITFASNLLGRTSRIGVGFAVLQTSLYHPVRLAEQLALLDILAQGRLTIGIGRGSNGNIYEYQGYDIDPNEAEARHQEILAILEQAWTSEGALRFDGNFWKVNAPAFRPRPASHGKPAFIKPAATEATLTTLALRGEPLLLGPQSFDETAHRVARYRALLAETGYGEDAIRDRLSRCWVWRNVYVAQTEAEARRIGGEAMRQMVENRAAMRRQTYAAQGLPPHAKDIAPAGAVPGTSKGLLCGEVGQIAAEFVKLRDLGLGGVITGFRSGPLAWEAAAGSLTLFMQDVAPLVRQ